MVFSAVLLGCWLAGRQTSIIFSCKRCTHVSGRFDYVAESFFFLPSDMYVNMKKYNTFGQRFGKPGSVSGLPWVLSVLWADWLSLECSVSGLAESWVFSQLIACWYYCLHIRPRQNTLYFSVFFLVILKPQNLNKRFILYHHSSHDVLCIYFFFQMWRKITNSLMLLVSHKLIHCVSLIVLNLIMYSVL